MANNAEDIPEDTSITVVLNAKQRRFRFKQTASTWVHNKLSLATAYLSSDSALALSSIQHKKSRVDIDRKINHIRGVI